MKWVMIGLLACTALTACETVQGAGRDLQKAGRVVEKAAE
jgi:predicted small secreted protein